MNDFEDLLFKIKASEKSPDKVKAGLEAMGHYNCNLLGFLKSKGPPIIIINPLHTNVYRKKSQSS